MSERVLTRGSASGFTTMARARSYSSLALVAGLVVGLAGCPDDPYKADTWTKKLGDSHEAERAVTELEQLGDPSAIEPIGNAWQTQGKPGRWLQAIISLARPLTKEEADKKNFTDYVVSGRPENWDKALPFLKKALSEVDEANQRSVESAIKAAEALGESKLPDGLDVLIEIAQRPVTRKLVNAQIAALRAIGKYRSDSAKAAAALIRVIDREPPPSPRTAKDQNRATLEEKYNLALGVTGAAINALGDLHVAAAAKPLVIAMYRVPDLFAGVRRALVASGPSAAEELRKILQGSHAEVNQLFKDKRLGIYCGDRNDAPPEQCQKVSAMTFYPAVVLGDFYDPRSVPDLLAGLKEPALPVGYVDDQPSPSTQYNAIFDSLRKIGSAEGAAAIRAIWMGHASPEPKAAKGGKKPVERAAAGAGEPDLNTRLLAINAYAFVSRDDVGLDELGKIAADNNADASLRQEAALAFARLAHETKDIAVLQVLAKKYLDASAAKRVEADGKLKTVADAADKEFDKAKKVMEAAKANSLRVSHDNTKSIEEIKAAATAATKADDDFKNNAKKVHRDAVAPYKAADVAAKQFKGYARMFQTHIARILVAIRCKQDLACYAATLKLSPDAPIKQVKDRNVTFKELTAAEQIALLETNLGISRHIADLKDWTKDELLGLAEANIERGMLELGKRGSKAASYTETLLDAAKNDDRLIRQSILLALPKIAAVPCKTCETKLAAVIRAGEGKTALVDLNLDTTMMKNYFGWAGGNTPSSTTTDKDDIPVPTGSKAPPPKKK